MSERAGVPRTAGRIRARLEHEMGYAVLSERDIEAALRSDMHANGGRLPDDGEIAALVDGDEELAGSFPHVVDLIEEVS